MSDRNVVSKYLKTCVATKSDFMMYIRYCGKSGSFKLFEIRGTLYNPPDNLGSLIILAAREYSCKSTKFLDAIVELQLDTLQLQARLETVLLSKGLDPMQNELLYEPPVVNTTDEFAEAFLFEKDKATDITFDLFDLNNIDGPQMLQLQSPIEEKTSSGLLLLT